MHRKYWPPGGAVVQYILPPLWALSCTANIGHQVALWSTTLYRTLWGSPTSPLFPPQNSQGQVVPMGYNALLATRGRCGAMCPIGHEGALCCNIYCHH